MKEEERNENNDEFGEGDLEHLLTDERTIKTGNKN